MNNYDKMSHLKEQQLFNAFGFVLLWHHPAECKQHCQIQADREVYDINNASMVQKQLCAGQRLVRCVGLMEKQVWSSKPKLSSLRPSWKLKLIQNSDIACSTITCMLSRKHPKTSSVWLLANEYSFWQKITWQRSNHTYLTFNLPLHCTRN